jgi:hypothetical protein
MIAHAGRLAIQAAAAGFTLLLLLLAAAAFLLARGPLSLGFLSSQLEQLLNEPGAPYQVAFDDTILAWDGTRRQLEVRVVNLRLLSAEGRGVAGAPQMAIGVNGAALLRGEFSLRSVELIQPRVWLIRREDGRVDLGLGDAEGDAGASLFGAFESGELPSFARGLERVSVTGADLWMEDRASKAVWRLPDSDLILRRTPDGLTMQLASAVELAGRRAALNATAEFRGFDQPLDFEFLVQDLNPAALALAFSLPALEPLKALAAPVSGSARLRLAPGDRLEAASFDLAGGAGEINLPELYPTPLAVQSFAAIGDYAPEGEALTLRDVYLDLGDQLSAQFSGVVWREADGVGVTGEGSLGALKVDALARYWPETAGPNARKWVLQRVKGGVVPEASFKLNLRPGGLGAASPPDDLVLAEFRYEGVSARFWDPLPPLVGGRGTAKLTAHEFTLAVQSGRVADIEISEGQVRIGNLAGRDQTAEVAFLARGPASGAFAILDAERLRFASDLGIKPSDAGGQAAVRARFKIPLERDIKLADVDYAAAATIGDLTLPELFGLYRLTDADLALNVDRAGLDAKGAIALNGVPAALTWRRDFGKKGVPDRYGLAAVLDDGGRQALGLTLAPYLTGPANLELQLLKHDDGRVEATGSADLAATALAIEELKWAKPPGARGRAEFQFTTGEKRPLLVDRVRLIADGFEATGSADLGLEGKLRSLRIQQARFGENDFAADIAFAPGAVSVQGRGRSFDLRPYFEGDGDGQTQPDPAAPAVDIAAAFERMLVSDAVALTGLQAKGARRQDRWAGLVATGSVNGGPPLRIEMNPAAGGQELAAWANDAGAVARASDLFGDMQGGTLAIVARIPDGPEPIKGRLVADDFRVVNAPFLTRIFTLGSLTGIVDAMSGEGISFKRLDIPFDWSKGKIAIGEASAVGAALGLTFTGEIDRKAETLALHGTVVPAYTINSLLGNIPLIGNLFVGRKGEGVFAVTFRAQGPLAEPEVSVNPLAALAPGFLRRFVELLERPSTSRAPEVPAAEPPPRASTP